MVDKMSERVLCFARTALEDLGYFEGLSLDIDRYFPALVSPPHAVYLPRAQAEGDASYKQVIPYALVFYDRMIFSYRRGKRGSEGRLHELYSIGVGGHVQPNDRGLFSHDPVGYADAMWREVREEIRLDAAWKEACVGALNLETTSVDRVHFGIVHIIQVAAPNVTKNESPITDCGFVPIEEAVRRQSRYENWSHLCLAQVDSLLAEADARFQRESIEFRV